MCFKILDNYMQPNYNVNITVYLLHRFVSDNCVIKGLINIWSNIIWRHIVYFYTEHCRIHVSINLVKIVTICFSFQSAQFKNNLQLLIWAVVVFYYGENRKRSVYSIYHVFSLITHSVRSSYEAEKLIL